MATSVDLEEHWEAFIRAEIASGRFGSASEVVQAGLRMLEVQGQLLENLCAHLAEGADQALRGEFADYSLEEVIAELDREA